MDETPNQMDPETAELLIELEPIVIGAVTELTGAGGDTIEDDNVVWGNF
jgi:hypothetical protein